MADRRKNSKTDKCGRHSKGSNDFFQQSCLNRVMTGEVVTSPLLWCSPRCETNNDRVGLPGWRS